MSSEIFELMKRPDERAVVEKAHRRPRFVEDCVREMVRGPDRRLPGARRRRLRAGPPGEPRDDPPAQRRGRALRAAAARFGRSWTRDDALAPPRDDARVAREPLLPELCCSRSRSGSSSERGAPVSAQRCRARPARQPDGRGGDRRRPAAPRALHDDAPSCRFLAHHAACRRWRAWRGDYIVGVVGHGASG